MENETANYSCCGIGKLDFSEERAEEAKQLKAKVEKFHRAKISDALRMEMIKAACLLMAARQDQNLSLPIATVEVFEFFSKKDRQEASRSES